MKKQNGSGGKSKRSLSKKVLNKKEQTYKGALEEVNKSKEKIQEYENIIESKVRIIPPEKEGDKSITIPLLPTEMNNYKYLLKVEKLNLKRKERALKKASDNLNKALKHQSEVVLSKLKTINEKVEAERKARREKDPRTNLVIAIVQKLETTNDPRFLKLTDALTDSRDFRNQLDTILQEEDPETYLTISGLSQVKTSVYKTVKEEYFGGTSDDDENVDGSTGESNKGDEDEETASMIVPAD